MKVIKPVTISGSRLDASNIPELDATYDPAAWAAATNYDTGALAARTTTHMVYRRKAPGGVDAALPESDTTKWEPVYPTNKWAMFDTSVGSKTKKSGAGTQQIIVDIQPGVATNSIAFFELNASTVQVQVFSTPGGAEVYNETINLDETILLDWYTYFFEPFSKRTAFVLNDLPPYSSGEIRVTITGTALVECGNFVVGTMYSMGSTGYGVGAGIRDYSKKTEDDATGVVTLEQSKFKKTMRARFKLLETQVNFVHNLLSDLRATPCVWIGDNGAGLEPLIVYGFYRDFQLDLPGAKHSYYSLEVEGMV